MNYSIIERNKYFFILSSFFVFYFHALNIEGFFHDGYLYAALGKNFPWINWLVPSQSDTEFREFFHHPPLFFILEGLFFKVVGSDFWQARIFGLIWIFFSINLIFYYLRSRFDDRLAFFATFLLLIIPSLMKKSRFPNMDQALLFSYTACLLCYFEAWKTESKKLWVLSGACWGLALLFKGASGILLLPLIFVHQIFVNKNLRFLIEKEIWLAFFTGLCVFSIWPISLYFTGRIDIFQGYLDFQFFNTIVDARGKLDNNYFLYVLHLFKNSPHLSILFLWSLYLLYKNEITKFKEFYIFNLICFLCYIIPLSFMKFKYSHYLIPIYPSYAIVAAFPIFLKIDLSGEKRFFKIWSIILIIAFVALYPLGVTSKVRRDKEIFQISKSFAKLKNIPKNWLIVEESYSYWAISGLSSYRFSANPHRLNNQQTIQYLGENSKDSLVFTSMNVEEGLMKILSLDFVKLETIETKNLICWVHKSILL